MKRIAVIFSVILSFACPLFADPVGEFSYVEGDVDLVRAGKSSKADFGMSVDNYDQVATGKNGSAELAIDPKSGINGSIKLRPGTTFYIDLAGAGAEKKAGIELLTGSVSAAVSKLAGKSNLEIRTQGATMGVRGTVFEVAIAPAGDLLVSCESGRVEVKDEGGRTLFAEPGAVVERTAEDMFRNVPVRTSNLADFRRQWNAERIEAFKANAGRAIADFAGRYRGLKERFDKAYMELLRHRDIIDKWMREDRQKTIGGRMEIMQEKKVIIASLFEIRKVLFLFEKIYFRLLELETYVAQGYGRGTIAPGLTAEQFFRQFQNEAVSLQEKMHSIRYVMKLFAARNTDGLIGEDLLGGEEKPAGEKTEEDSFFEKK
jgi:hypothetical protein